MKSIYMKRITYILFILGVALFSSCSRDYSEEISSLAGVWEGSMTTSGSNASVRILSIEEQTAEIYDMTYTLEGYQVSQKQTSSVDMTRKKRLDQICITIDGKKEYFIRKDKALRSIDNEYIFMLSDNTLDYYNKIEVSPSLLPHDKEYVGPKSYNPLLQNVQLASSIGWESLLEWVAGGAVTAISSKATSALLDYIFKDNTETRALADVIDKVDAISDQLAQMEIEFHDQNYEKYLNDRSRYIYEIKRHNSECYIRLSNAKDDDTRREIITEWALATVGGCPAYEQGMNYISFLVNTIVEQKDIFNMYDLYVYNTTPWENLGYDIREALRESDIALAAESLFLTQLYQKFRTNIDEDSREAILNMNQQTFTEFYDHIKARPVVHHDDYAICQIPGAHFVVLRGNHYYPYYTNPDWCPIPAVWTRFKSDDYFIWGPNQAENYTQAFTVKEISTILSFYNGNKNLYQIFQDDAHMRFVNSINPDGGSQKGAIFLQSGYYSADWHRIGTDATVPFEATKPEEIVPGWVGKAIIDGSGIVGETLELVRWEEFNNRIWPRSIVVERENNE